MFEGMMKQTTTGENIPIFFGPAAQGWQCPACGYVWAPGVQGCGNCNRPEHEKSTITATPVWPTRGMT